MAQFFLRSLIGAGASAAAMTLFAGCDDAADTGDDLTDSVVYPDIWGDDVDDDATAADGGDDASAETGGDVDAAPDDAGGNEDSGDDVAESDTPPDVVEPPVALALSRLWDTTADGALSFADCVYASPLAYEGAAGIELIVTVGDVVAGLDRESGALLWSVDLPEPAARRAMAAAAPVIVGDLLVVAYQVHANGMTDNTLDSTGTGVGAADSRDGHWVAVIDLAERRLAGDFAPLQIRASVPGNDGTVTFRASNQFSRSDLVWVPAESGLGLVYVTYGNVRDIQPWHGWVFEIDLDAWRSDVDDAIAASLVTTPETDCGTSGTSGSRQRICGGGLWAPSGPLLVESDESYSLILAPGNGQLDLARNDFANSLMRVGRGLNFAHGCDEAICADFDPDAPDVECVETCDALFVPRPMPGEADPAPESGVCEGLSFFECWQALDYIGGSTPVFVQVGEDELLVYPTKDGHLYLVDFNNLGVMHDRLQLVEYCGTAEDPCRWDWAGMIVTQPAVVEVDGETRVMVPTFMPDSTHPAGVVSVAVVSTPEGPRLARRWDFPRFDSPEAITRFRAHPTRPALLQRDGATYVVVGEPSVSGGRGRVDVLDVANGARVTTAEMQTNGYRFARPLVVDQRIYVTSCESDRGRGRIEAFELVEDTQP